MVYYLLKFDIVKVYIRRSSIMKKEAQVSSETVVMTYRTMKRHTIDSMLVKKTRNVFVVYYRRK